MRCTENQGCQQLTASLYSTLKHVIDPKSRFSLLVSLFLPAFEVQFLKTWHIKKSYLFMFRFIFLCISSFIRCLLHTGLLHALLALWRHNPYTVRSPVQVFRCLVLYYLLVSVVGMLVPRTFPSMNEESPLY